MEPPTTGQEAIGHDESPVHNWRVSQLERLGVPGPLAADFCARGGLYTHRVVVGYWAFKPDLSASVRIDPVFADFAHIFHFSESSHLERWPGSKDSPVPCSRNRHR